MHELAPLIYDLAIMLGLAGVAVVICQRIHQPVVLGYLLAGMVLGPYTPPYELLKDLPNIQVLSVLGVIFLMFTLGLEFSFRKLTQVGLSALVVGTIEVILMILIGYGVGQLLGWSYYDSLFLGAALSISSTTIIIKAVEELKLKNTPFAELIFGVLIVEDLLAILLLVALSTIVLTNHVFSMDMFHAALQLVMVVGGWFLVGYFIMPPLFRKIGKYISEETLTILAVSLCLILVCIAVKLHYSAALGAFIMGSILAETVLVHRIENLMKPIRDIFGAVFFISVGMLIDPHVIVQHWYAVMILSLVTIIGKIVTTSFAALITGESVNTSVRVGFGMAQVGEFSFIIAALGLSLNVTSEILYPLVVAVSGITTFTTPYLIKISGRLTAKIEGALPEQAKSLLNNYSLWVNKSENSSKKNILFNKRSLRLFFNGMLVAIIFTLVDNVVYPEVALYGGEETWITNTISLGVAMFASAPFIWGMMFSYRSKTFTPAYFIVWTITFFELAILSILYFQTWLTFILFLVIGLASVVALYRWLEKYYKWLERQLVKNIKAGE